MSLKPWRELAVPHEDVHKGTYQQAEFAADISRVHDGTATAEYQNPILFFRRTFITEGMATLLTSVAQRLAGKGGDPVIQLQTAFGGGKTHAMLAVMHLVSGKAVAADLAGIPALLAGAKIAELPSAHTVVLDGIKLSPSQPRKVNGHRICTLWGELAWQLGGPEAYVRVAQADATGTSPGKDVLSGLIHDYSPCVILVDELVAYIRQFEDAKSLPGGTFDSNLTFVQALTEAMKATPRAALLASLPESEREAGSQRGIAALRALEHYFGRVQAIWKPVSTDESFEIVRRRLFSEIQDRASADAVCRAFADHYVANADALPGETQEARYYERLHAAYPIHPEVFVRLYEDWSALQNFQRTRGVLKLMARVIHRLWQDNNQDLLLMPGSLPLYDRDVHTELTNYLGAGWDAVIDKDVDGERSEPADLEQREPRFGAVQACRRVARSIFLGSAPSSINEGARGIETERIVLGCLQPGQAPHIFRDALGRLEGRLTYLSKGGNRWWLDVRPNLRREMEQRKRRFTEGDVAEEIETALRRVTGQHAFEGLHVFTPAADIPDDWGLRLVVLPPAMSWTRTGPNDARDAAAAILRSRGDQPRQKQNRLLFLAADSDQVIHLKETVRALLAWRSIVSDANDLRMTLDNQQIKQATQYRDQTLDTVHRLAREAYRWLIAPNQTIQRDSTPSEITWEAFQLNPAAPGLGKEIDRVMRENELVITEWAPVHLHNLLQTWFWRDGAKDAVAQDVWAKSCSYLYFPRLAGSRVFQATVNAGAASRDFFGIATDRQGEQYRGFSLGKAAAIYLDALLLIEPKAAAEYERLVLAAQTATSSTSFDGTPTATQGPTALAEHTPATTAQNVFTRYFATVELDPVKATLQFSKLVSELIELFSGAAGTNVTLNVEIEAVDARGFKEHTVRAAKENGKALGVKAEFE